MVAREVRDSDSSDTTETPDFGGGEEPVAPGPIVGADGPAEPEAPEGGAEAAEAAEPEEAEEPVDQRESTNLGLCQGEVHSQRQLPQVGLCIPTPGWLGSTRPKKRKEKESIEKEPRKEPKEKEPKETKEPKRRGKQRSGWRRTPIAAGGARKHSRERKTREPRVKEPERKEKGSPLLSTVSQNISNTSCALSASFSCCRDCCPVLNETFSA